MSGDSQDFEGEEEEAEEDDGLEMRLDRLRQVWLERGWTPAEVEEAVEEARQIHREADEEAAAEQALELALADPSNWLDPQDILLRLAIPYEGDQDKPDPQYTDPSHRSSPLIHQWGDRPLFVRRKGQLPPKE